MKPKETICSICGAVIKEGVIHTFDNATMCDRCFISETVICRHCEERVWRSDTTDGDLCSSCFENSYTHCCDCGAIIHYDDAFYLHDDEDSRNYPYCTHCYPSQDKHAIIHDYLYKPDPIYYGQGKLFYGVELELDEGGEYDSSAQSLLDVANFSNEHIYIKHDGSLDNGFEIVTHPMTLEYHLNTMPWRDLLHRAVQSGYRSHSPGSCGIHVHLSRAGLGDTYEEQEQAIGRILFFFERFWSEILLFSRRTHSQCERWARRYGGGVVTPKKTLEHAKSTNFGRYMAVNLENSQTVELRIFRGTLKYTTFIAVLQFVAELCRIAIFLSDELMESMTWMDFVRSIPSDKKELIEYLKSKLLYVNEPITAEEEI